MRPLPAGLFYTTVEAVRGVMDIKATAYMDAQIRRILAASTRSVESLTHRHFYPWTGIRYFDWPRGDYARSWRLWLGGNDLISATTVVAGGTTIASSDYFLEPVNAGPPYTHLEIDLSSSAALSAEDTHQRQIAITGVWGYSNDEEEATTAAEALDASETGVDVANSATVGVGDLLRVDSERLIVTGRSMLDTGQNCTALTAADNDRTITGITAGTIHIGEILLVDAERMLVLDVAGTTVTVRRAWDGSALAAHSNGADIYAPRTLTVTRGAVGTTAATHLTSATVYRQVYPGLVQEQCLAETVNTLAQERSGYAREIGSGENAREASGRGLKAIREECYTAHGRKARKAAV